MLWFHAWAPLYQRGPKSITIQQIAPPLRWLTSSICSGHNFIGFTLRGMISWMAQRTAIHSGSDSGSVLLFGFGSVQSIPNTDGPWEPFCFGQVVYFKSLTSYSSVGWSMQPEKGGGKRVGSGLELWDTPCKLAWIELSYSLCLCWLGLCFLAFVPTQQFLAGDRQFDECLDTCPWFPKEAHFGVRVAWLGTHEQSCFLLSTRLYI